MTVGLIFFVLGDVSVSPTFDVRGVGFISIALIADAIIGNVQEQTMRELKITNNELIFYSYSIGALLLYICTILTGQFLAPFYYCLEHTHIYGGLF